MRSKLNRSLYKYMQSFLATNFACLKTPRQNAIIHFGNIISFVLDRHEQFQTEMFIVPFENSSFTAHRHPNVDVFEYGLTGKVHLIVDGKEVCTATTLHNWSEGRAQTEPVFISHTSIHSGYADLPYSFLSFQHWLNGKLPVSVGLDWEGEYASQEQELLNANAV